MMCADLRMRRLTVCGGAWLAGVCFQGAVMGAAASTPPASYTYIDLGILGDPGNGGSSAAWAMNNANFVVGASTTEVFGAGHAFAWQEGKLIDLGVIGGGTFAASAAYGINEVGVIVGQTSVSSSEPPHAFVYENGEMDDLGTGFGAGSFSRAWDINAAGRIVGERSMTQLGAIRAFVWERGVFTDLGTLGGGASGGVSSIAYAINDLGQIVGTAAPPMAPLHGFVWQDGVMQDLGTLGGNNEATEARAINNLSQIVGSSPTEEGAIHAFLWQDGVMQDLGTLGGNSSYAYGINIHGDVVGGSRLATSPPGNAGHAFVWHDGVMVDLNDVVTNLPEGVVLEVARSINDSGHIVGTTCGTLCEPGVTELARAFLLVPVAAPIIPGDLNGDGEVDGTDLGQLLAAWSSDDPGADLNNDGIVDGADLGLVLAGWTR